MSLQDAIAAGFTQEVLASCDEADLTLFIRPETDLDDRFKAYAADEERWVVLNGWLFVFETPSCEVMA